MISMIRSKVDLAKMLILQSYFICSTSESFVTKDIEEISDISIDEKVNGEIRIDTKTGMSPKLHNGGDNNIPNHISNSDKNVHSLRRRIDTSSINENEDISNNFTSEILFSFFSIIFVFMCKMCQIFISFRLY